MFLNAQCEALIDADVAPQAPRLVRFGRYRAILAEVLLYRDGLIVNCAVNVDLALQRPALRERDG
jgi:hypothetical protein